MTVDVGNVIYRHYFQIKNPDGSPYTNPDGEEIGHLIGLCNQVSVLYEAGVLPLFVFDGKPPDLKRETMRKRAARTRRSGFKITSDMCSQMKKALEVLGVPWVQAPEEAESQASHMTRYGFSAVITNDYDALLFGANRMVRSISDQELEMVNLSSTLEQLEIDHRSLIDMAILMGTDYNPGGIRGYGPKRALSLAKECDSLEQMLEKIGLQEENRKELYRVEEYFRNPPVIEEWNSQWRKPDLNESLDYLTTEMKIGRRTIERVVQRANSALSGPDGQQTTLD